MAKGKGSASERKPSSASPEKRRRSASQPKPVNKNSASIHYEIDTVYGRLVCDYDPSTSLSTDGQGDVIAAIIKAIKDRFDENLDTSPKHPGFASKVKARARKEGITIEQAEERIRQEHYVSCCLHEGAAWIEFSNGLGRAIENAVSQHFEMSIVVARMQNRTLKPHLGIVEDVMIELVKQQIKDRVKSADVGGGPLVMLAWHYYVCLRDWQAARLIYRRNRDSASWRKQIKDEYPNLPDDLIEWLAPAEGDSRLEAEAFKKLPEDAFKRLNERICRDGYNLSQPSEIALEHAARLCGSPHYNNSTTRLKNLKSEHSELAERMGVRHYLKNTEPIRSQYSVTTEN